MQCSVCEVNEATKTYHEWEVCQGCLSRIMDYADKLDRRIERLNNAADRASTESSELWKRGHEMADAIPLGQPILVGHHSEKRDRNYRDKIYRTHQRAYEAGKRAAHLAERAQAAEENHAISSDNPLAIKLLEEKLAKLETDQAEMREINKKIRQCAKLPAEQQAAKLAELCGVTVESATKWLEPDYLGRVGFPSYMFANGNGRIKATKDRIKQLKRQQAQRVKGNREEEYGDLRVVWNVDENRLQLFFPGKPSAEIRTELKQCAFKWSPSVGAWVNYLTTNTNWKLMGLIKLYAPDAIRTFQIKDQVTVEGKQGTIVHIGHDYYGVDFEDGSTGNYYWLEMHPAEFPTKVKGNKPKYTEGQTVTVNAKGNARYPQDAIGTKVFIKKVQFYNDGTIEYLVGLAGGMSEYYNEDQLDPLYKVGDPVTYEGEKAYISVMEANGQYIIVMDGGDEYPATFRELSEWVEPDDELSSDYDGRPGQDWFSQLPY